MPKREPKLSRAAFERTVHAHHAAVHRTCLRIVRDEATALDVTQQVYVALLEGRIVLSGDGDERVLRWFAVRVSLQEMRGTSNRKKHEESFAMQHETASSHDPVAERDSARTIDRMIAALPEDLRLAMRLRFDEGLTYGRIGEALSISEPSAHERVKRALERLREKLSGAGFAALGTGLEDHLISSAQLPAPLPPPHVAKGLVALHAQAAGGALAGAGGIAMALAGAAAAVVLWVAFAGAQETDPPRDTFVMDASETVPPVVAAAEPVEPASTEPASSMRTSLQVPAPPVTTAPRVDKMGEGTLRGRLVDDKDQPVRDVVLVAESVEREGKFSRYAGRARTEHDGSFSIVVPAAEGGTHYEIAVVGETLPSGFDGLAGRGKDKYIRAEAGRAIEVDHVRLRPGPRDEPGSFTLVLRVVDERGGPVVGAIAVLHRNVRSPEGWSPRTWEAGGPTDAGGMITMKGEHVGSKHLTVEARKQGFKKLRRDMTIAAGAHEQTIVLAAGLEIAGTLADVDGRPVTPKKGEPAHMSGFQVYARGASSLDEWIFASVDARGAFLLRGLDDEEHNLEVQGGEWSRVCMTGVRAGTRDLALRLKRYDDPRDVGDHCAEIHARVIDAATGQPVKVNPGDTEVDVLPAGITRAEFESAYAPSMQWERPRQTAMFGPTPEPSDRVRCTGLEGGTYAFIVRSKGYATAIAGPIVLAPHAVSNDVVIELSRPVEITGRVLDADGEPIAGAFVMLCGLGAHADEVIDHADKDVRATNGKPGIESFQMRPTGKDGRFKIGGVAPGLECTVVALHEKRLPVRSALVRTGTSSDVELRFAGKR